MHRDIEAVLSEARTRLQVGEPLAAIAAAYPEYAAELTDLLTGAAQLQALGRSAARARSRQAASAAYTRSFNAATVAELLRRERATSGLSAAEQARRSGLSVESLGALEQEQTPIAALDPAAIKGLAQRVKAPFAALAKELKRLASLEALQGLGGAAPVFTRGPAAGQAERQELLELVRRTRQARPAGGEAPPPRGG